MKDSAVVVRPYAENDREGVRALLRATFGDSLGFDRFELGNPLGPAIRAVAADGNRIVGFNQWQPWLIPGAETVSTFQSGASAVDESFRGHRLFSRLLAEGESQAIERRAGFFIGFPNPASLGAFVRAGWTVAQSLGLRCKLIPTFGARHDAANQAIEELPSFYRWRYKAAGVDALMIGKSGRVALVRRIRDLGLPAMKLLDVLDSEGTRPDDLLVGLSGSLPAGRIVTLRSSRSARGAMSLAIPRRWKTPFIIKRLTGDAFGEKTLRQCALLYGDIDAA